MAVTKKHTSLLLITVDNILYVKEQKRLLCVRRRLLSKSEYPFQVAYQHFIVEQKEGETG